MHLKLNETEIRILSSLTEKEFTTPEYYPMSINALTNACNQKNNREPITNYDENIVEETISNLREKRLVFRVTGDGIRTPKYNENFNNTLNLQKQEIAILNILMLRGPQTIGELKNRGSRIYEFKTLDEVESILNALANKEIPLIVKLPKLAGTKEPRYFHTLLENFSIENFKISANETELESDKISLLEKRVENLESEIKELKNIFEIFKKQFE